MICGGEREREREIESGDDEMREITSFDNEGRGGGGDGCGWRSGDK